jgi:nicotinate-nucleotide adenylyltransferase
MQPQTPRTIAVFGGTFDPVHLGHLIMAEQCRDQAALDQVWFVPAARPPHKLDRPLTPFERRVEMIQLAIAGNSAFRVEEMEKDRTGPSYTVDTLEELHRQHPDVSWHFLLGSDSLPEFLRWRQPQRIVALASLLVVARPNNPIMPVEEFQRQLALPAGVRLRLQLIESPLIDISSRELRRRCRRGRSIRYMVPRAVEAYIADKQLYPRSEPTP